MKTAQLEVFVVGDNEPFKFNGEDAKNMHYSIQKSFADGSGLAISELKNGYTTTFILSNISAIHYSGGDAHD